MTLASDQDLDPGRLSPASLRMLALRDTVIEAWEARVRSTVNKARALAHPILIDTLPVFYNDIAEALTPGSGRLSGVDGTTTAAEHGGERARLTSYDHESLIIEYQLLRRAILDVLHADGVQLSPTEILVINDSIDAAIQEAVCAFTLVHSALRERFAAALTHDLRAPLAATMSALELIQMVDDPVRMKALAAKGLTNARRMGEMVQELLHTMAFHSGERLALVLSRFDIQALATEVQDEALAQGALVEVEGDAVLGCWDRPALRRAIENIVGNALKYGQPGTPIRIVIEGLHQRMVLSVHNEGEPIPEQDRESIFQMYRRSDAARQNRQQGWGIGLPYVRAVAESHGGSITLESSHERGTTFTLNIPIDAAPYEDAPTLP